MLFCGFAETHLANMYWGNWVHNSHYILTMQKLSYPISLASCWGCGLLLRWWDLLCGDKRGASVDRFHTDTQSQTCTVSCSDPRRSHLQEVFRPMYKYNQKFAYVLPCSFKNITSVKWLIIDPTQHPLHPADQRAASLLRLLETS